ncbi:hypothetical protein [Pedobacter sp. Hv1]|uniref:hypothetical protein n=1 Tax=Pedobacter sp. Hv1 TaxID=1740090 RepID=UPI0006D89033|nr:hypothetical protein [Pedobacter sp. Hv1]KQC01084.1 hypothetical protein AQF98_10490 [Pedobacter sp. Hv1]
MLKKILFLLMCFTSFLFNASAQDTSAYESQRLKINTLLAERSIKFGQYDESLNAKTGIFGFQTKRDIRNSNEILRQIALNDNDIFKELKVLLDFKDLQVQQAVSTSSTSTESIQNYRRTIKILQDQNQNYSKSIDQVEKSRDLAYFLMALFLIGCTVLTYLFITKSKKLKRYEKANI